MPRQAAIRDGPLAQLKRQPETVLFVGIKAAPGDLCVDGVRLVGVIGELMTCCLLRADGDYPLQSSRHDSPRDV
jgi:hypothetical protein